jgi:hypothetical protein
VPALALQAVFAVDDSGMLDPGAGAVEVAGWVIVMSGGAAVVLRHRDV